MPDASQVSLDWVDDRGEAEVEEGRVVNKVDESVFSFGFSVDMSTEVHAFVLRMRRDNRRCSLLWLSCLSSALPP